jgi:hypothetical protein
MPWGEAQSVASGDVDLCFQPPRELEGSMRLRFDLSAGGATYSFYSPDTVLLLGGESACVASDTVCCAAAQEPAVCSAPDAGCDAQPDAPDAAPSAHEADGGRPRRTAAADGCSAPGATQAGPWSLIALLLWLARALKRRAAPAR